MFNQLDSRSTALLGAVIVFVGVLGVYGSATGLLAPMIAALFYPVDLTMRSSGGFVTPVPAVGKSGSGEPTDSNPPELNPGSVDGTPYPEVGQGMAYLPPAP